MVKTFRRRCHRALLLTGDDIKLLIGSGLLVGIIRLGLWILPFRLWRQILAKTSGLQREDQSNNPVSQDCMEAAKRIVWAVSVTSRLIPAASCLTQALATKILLSRIDIPSNLHIGVTLGEKQKLEAHAWVELGGRVIIGGNISRYTRLLALEEVI